MIMDFKRSLLSLFFLLIIFLSQTPPTSQLILDDDFSDCFDIYRNSKSATVVAFSRIAKRLRDSGPHRRIITSVLERNLRSLSPRCEEGFLFFVDSKNKLTIFDANEEASDKKAVVTLFVPWDEAIGFGEGIRLGNQIAMAKVDKAAFESGKLSKGSELAVSNRHAKSKLVVSHVWDDDGGLRVSIHGVNVTQWDIYNDGHVIVHGTDDSFQLGIFES